MFIAIVLIVLGLEGAAIVHHKHQHHAHRYSPAQSWDQANLKQHDSGCPTAIYVAPRGNLEQCDD